MAAVVALDELERSGCDGGRRKIVAEAIAQKRKLWARTPRFSLSKNFRFPRQVVSSIRGAPPARGAAEPE